MNLKPYLIILLTTVFFANLSEAAVIYSENFDSLSKDYICCSASCSTSAPPGYSEFHSNTMGLNYGQCNCQIIDDAQRGTGGRGMRIYLEQDSWPTGENVLKKNLGANRTLLYIRWYMKESTNNFTNFEKLFRLKESSGQILIPEWKYYNSNTVYMNLWNVNTGNQYFTGFNLKTDVATNAWHCYELKIDLVSKNAQFWVDGVSKGIISNSSWSTGWYISDVEIGGNQYGHTWSSPIEHTRDYDDIVIGTTYVGTSGGGGSSDTTPPIAPTGLHIE